MVVYEVLSAGTCVEWTQSRDAAHKAFADAGALPKQLNRIDGSTKVLLDYMDRLGRRTNKREAEAA
jgi:hypothetical protein